MGDGVGETMPRVGRIEYAGACYHVINRGNYRRNLFEADGAREAFERTLFETMERFGWRVHAYVIMRNHFHLAGETPEANLSAGMKWLQGTWVARFNRFRGIAGRPFQGRFKALHVEPGHALAEVAHYIHLNPVRAGVVGADAVGSFRWSSLHHFRGKSRPAGLESITVRAEAGGLPDTAAGWKRYLAYLALRAEEELAERRKRFGRLSRGWCIGSATFRDEMRARLGHEGAGGGIAESRFAGLEPEERRRERELGWESQLKRVADAAGIDLEALPTLKSAPEKVVLAVLLRRVSDVSNGWLAERLRMGAAASVSQYARRFRLAGGEEAEGFSRVLSKVKT